ncbi:MAG: hypothetical protein EBX80_04100 [Acidimicrobiia bacterium]|nr:hypothetical protein [Acidimicrobiia bacterium]
MFTTILNPSALASSYALNVRVINARAFKSCAAKFTNFATKSSKSRWFEQPTSNDKRKEER